MMPENNPTPLPLRIGNADTNESRWDIYTSIDGEYVDVAYVLHGTPYAPGTSDGYDVARRFVEAVNGYAALQERLEAAEAERLSLGIEYGNAREIIRLQDIKIGALESNGASAYKAAGDWRARAEAAERLNGELVAELAWNLSARIREHAKPLNGRADAVICPGCGSGLALRDGRPLATAIHNEDGCSIRVGYALLARIKSASTSEGVES